MRTTFTFRISMTLSFLLFAVSAFADVLYVKVLDQNGRAIRGAKVGVLRASDATSVQEIGPFVSWTTASGITAFPDLIPGRYGMRISSPGYVAVEMRAVPILGSSPVPYERIEKLIVVLNRIRQAH